MGHILEIEVIEGYPVFFVEAQDSRRRRYFSAFVRLPNSDQLVLDDRILPRLKEIVRQVTRFRATYDA